MIINCFLYLTRSNIGAPKREYSPGIPAEDYLLKQNHFKAITSDNDTDLIRIMCEKPDDTLLQQIKDNDQAALEKLFEKYYYPLCDFAFQFVRSFDLTEEVVSDVFMAIWKKRRKLVINSSFKAYLYTAVRNQSLNYLKKEKRDFESLDLLENEASEKYQPDEELIFSELENRIEILINTLPPRRKLIFKLSRVEGFTYQEIADILSISIHTVQNQMVQAVKQLASYSLIDND